MATEIRTEIVIAAPAGKVWRVLTDFASFPQWNPFLVHLSGELKEGGKISASMQLPGERGKFNLAPTLTAVEAEKRLSWLGSLFFPGVFDGKHSFELLDNGQGSTLFIQHETFSGILSPLILALIGKKTRQGFELMNAALKKRAEGAD